MTVPIPRRALGVVALVAPSSPQSRAVHTQATTAAGRTETRRTRSTEIK